MSHAPYAGNRKPAAATSGELAGATSPERPRAAEVGAVYVSGREIGPATVNSAAWPRWLAPVQPAEAAAGLPVSPEGRCVRRGSGSPAALSSDGPRPWSETVGPLLGQRGVVGVGWRDNTWDPQLELNIGETASNVYFETTPGSVSDVLTLQSAPTLRPGWRARLSLAGRGLRLETRPPGRGGRAVTALTWFRSVSTGLPRCRFPC